MENGKEGRSSTSLEAMAQAEKEYRLRIKESEKALIVKALAKSLKSDLEDFLKANEKLINSYNNLAFSWQQKYEIRKQVEGPNGAIIRSIDQTYRLLQRLTFAGRGRPYLRDFDAVSDWDHQRIFEECNKILDV